MADKPEGRRCTGSTIIREESDTIFVECRDVERSIVGMQGLYQLQSWRDANGGHREFSCRVLKMSSGLMKITGPVTGSVGEWVTVHLDRLGLFNVLIWMNAWQPQVARDQRGLCHSRRL